MRGRTRFGVGSSSGLGLPGTGVALTRSWFKFSRGFRLTALVQASLEEKSGTSFLPDSALCVCVSKAGRLCLLVPKDDELQKYRVGVSHSVQQEGSRKPLWAPTFQSSSQRKAKPSSPSLHGRTPLFTSPPHRPPRRNYHPRLGQPEIFARCKQLRHSASAPFSGRGVLKKRGEGRGALHLLNGERPDCTQQVQFTLWPCPASCYSDVLLPLCGNGLWQPARKHY